MRTAAFSSVLFSLLFCSQNVLAAMQSKPSDDLRAMTFNVRFPNPEDGSNRWSLRAPIFIETIRRAAPDIIGTQEIFSNQAHDLISALPKYQWFGVDRFGAHRDEHMGIFYRTDRLQLIRQGTFWLSQKPNEAGSMSWGEALPRYVNWGVFKTKTQHPYQFLLLDTHLANRDDEDRTARLESARLILQYLAQLPADLPIILTADLNSSATDTPHQLLATVLTDAHATAKKVSGPVGTFHDFTGRPQARIDFIMSRGFVASSVHTDDFHRGSHYPSDHFPVEAVLHRMTGAGFASGVVQSDQPKGEKH